MFRGGNWKPTFGAFFMRLAKQPRAMVIRNSQYNCPDLNLLQSRSLALRSTQQHMSVARTYNYLHLDVFTDRPLTGNQLAVFLDGAGLETDAMQSIALEMAFSETTFVFPAEDPGTHYRVRIF